MNSKIKKAAELTEGEINRMYEIYTNSYGKKNLNVPEDEWKWRVKNKPYHGIPKWVQLYSHVNDIINGYVIFTEPKFVNNVYWSKISENATDFVEGLERYIVHESKIRNLPKEHEGSPWYFLTEVEETQDKVIGIYMNSGFTKLRNLEYAKSLVDKLIPVETEVFLEDNVVKSIRNTRLKQGRKAVLLVNLS